ncbi:hypothetical protein O181_035258 [Austropuccinia psidii MF-1]|uniref:Uncharacterized protein n=1 Tax=Austropuccinia psidii MF-1 TaxID=1389203 RepID=A0A9Q3D537_9BASI|nr:hypothetical protein [Austropuccinia psidii MF-1]
MNVTKKNNKKGCTFEYTIDSLDQGDEIINLEVYLNDIEAMKAETPPALNETIHYETPPASPQNIQVFQESEKIKLDTMGQDMPDIIPELEHKVSPSANDQGTFSIPH